MIAEIAKLFGVTSSRKVEALIKQVADASIAPVCERLAEEMDAMSLPEARGYIRARAARVVRRETRIAINRLPKTEVVCSEVIIRSATEKLVPLVLRQLSVGVPRSSSLPMAA